MKRVGITGQSGFIGSHLYNTLSLTKEKYQLVEFKKNYFNDSASLDLFVAECDIIVHLAAVNRHPNAEIIFNDNIKLALKLTESLNRTGSKANVIFSSSTQEESDNVYGRAKKKAREILAKSAKERGTKFTGLIIPNVFGPFGNPFYNSVIATFCHQLTHNQKPLIINDNELKLIFVAELVDVIIKSFEKEPADMLIVKYTHQFKVSEILTVLQRFKQDYFDFGIIPSFENKFELNLFNTFRSYIDLRNHYPVNLKKSADSRGIFVEVAKLKMGGQVSFSTTMPGITRGNHYHTRKIERFTVIKGKALIQLRKIGTTEVFDFQLDGNDPSYVDIPVWYTHNIKNVGDDELYTVFWINEFYDPTDHDTYMEIV